MLTHDLAWNRLLVSHADRLFDVRQLSNMKESFARLRLGFLVHCRFVRCLLRGQPADGDDGEDDIERGLALAQARCEELSTFQQQISVDDAEELRGDLANLVRVRSC